MRATIALLLDLSGLTLSARVSEWHHRKPRVDGTELTLSFAQIEAERVDNEVCLDRRGPQSRDRAAAALEIASQHGPRCVLSSYIKIYAHGERVHELDLLRDHPLEPAKPFPSAWTKHSRPNLAIITAGRAPARTRARDLVSNRAVVRSGRFLSLQPPSRRAAAWCANCSVLVGRSSFLTLRVVK